MIDIITALFLSQQTNKRHLSKFLLQEMTSRICYFKNMFYKSSFSYISMIKRHWPLKNNVPGLEMKTDQKFSFPMPLTNIKTYWVTEQKGFRLILSNYLSE